MKRLLALILVLSVTATTSATLLAQESTPPSYTATTAGDSKVSKPQLKVRLRPLTKEQCQAEVDAWQAALIERNIAIRDLLLATPEADATPLREEQKRIVDRLSIAIDAFVARGGDGTAYRQYIAASTRADLDATDVGATVKVVLTWLKSPEGGIRVGLNIIKFLVTMMLFWLLSRLAARLVGKAVSRMQKTSSLLRTFFVNATRKTVFFLGFIFALTMLEFDITPFIAALGAAGLVVGLALQGTLSNFASGMMILIYRPYDVGDVVTVAGQTGKVDDMTLVSTTMRLFDNQIVVVPNNSIWNDVITNATHQKTRRVDMKFGCGYADDLQAIQSVLQDIVETHPKVLAEPAPVIKLHELADSSVNFIVRPWTNTADYWDVFWDVTRQVKERFDQEGLSIPFPQRDVHMHQPTA
ncbi:MAG: mechanosensitive ion channel family protein [Planctomycetota bacterium]